VDVGAKVEIYRMIRALADQGIAVLMISSELAEVVGLADRVVVMAQGRVTGELVGAEMSEESVMRLAVTSHDRRAEGAVQ
jgi:ribose transport system ATP-binding protein